MSYKSTGRGNVVLEDALIPEPGDGEVRVKAVRSLIRLGAHNRHDADLCTIHRVPNVRTFALNLRHGSLAS